MERIILHSDLNNFYASVECLYRPEIRSHPVAVCGDVEQRHGIVLAKNVIAKEQGVKTGQPLWQARQLCPGILFVPADFDKYLRFSKLVRKIYCDYTSQVEPFGLDECWLDITGPGVGIAEGKKLADELRQRIFREIGLTVSVGVSYNKVFAKLGSDMKKPNATTVISKQSFRAQVWPLPVKDLLYVGSATARKLSSLGIHTIGDLACSDVSALQNMLGKVGGMLWRYANGMDTSPVAHILEQQQIKSIGNSTTTPRDLVSQQDIKLVLYLLCESVAARLRSRNLMGQTVHLFVRDFQLHSYTRQHKLLFPTQCASDLFDAAYLLYQKHHTSGRPVRSLGVSASHLESRENMQLFFTSPKDQRQNALEAAIDDIRRRFGPTSIQRGIVVADPTLGHSDMQKSPTSRPVGFSRQIWEL